jgi:hypothetical protein
MLSSLSATSEPAIKSDSVAATSSAVTTRNQAAEVLDYVAAVDLSIEAVVGLKPWDEKIAQRLDLQFQDLLAKGETFERKGSATPLDACFVMSLMADEWWHAKWQAQKEHQPKARSVVNAADRYTEARRQCMAQIRAISPAATAGK